MKRFLLFVISNVLTLCICLNTHNFVNAMENFMSIESERTIAMRELERRIDEASLRGRTIFAQRVNPEAEQFWKQAEYAAYFKCFDLSAKLYKQSASCYDSTQNFEYAVSAYWKSGVAYKILDDSENGDRMFKSCAESYVQFLNMRETRGEITALQSYVYKLVTVIVCSELRWHLAPYLIEHIAQYIPRLKELSRDERKELFLQGIITISFLYEGIKESVSQLLLEPFLAFQENPVKFLEKLGRNTFKDAFWSTVSSPFVAVYEIVTWIPGKVVSGISWLFSKPLRPALIIVNGEDNINQIRTELEERGFTVCVLENITSTAEIHSEIEGFIGYIELTKSPLALLYVSGVGSLEGDYQYLISNLSSFLR